jgi:hypothetical protein
MTEIGEIYWQLEQHKQLRGGCSCGDSTILGVIHSDTKPCSLPIAHLPLTEHQIQDIGVNYADLGGDIGCKNWEPFVRAIEKAHGIGGINEV